MVLYPRLTEYIVSNKKHVCFSEKMEDYSTYLKIQIFDWRAFHVCKATFRSTLGMDNLWILQLWPAQICIPRAHLVSNLDAIHSWWNWFLIISMNQWNLCNYPDVQPEWIRWISTTKKHYTPCWLVENLTVACASRSVGFAEHQATDRDAIPGRSSIFESQGSLVGFSWLQIQVPSGKQT